MAVVLKGKYKSEVVELRGWANDWFSVDLKDGSTAILKPTQIRVTIEEAKAWQSDPSGMDREYELIDCMFRKLGTRPEWPIDTNAGNRRSYD